MPAPLREACARAGTTGRGPRACSPCPTHIAVVGLAVWGAQSDADEPQEAAAAATLEPTRVSDQGKAAFEQVSTDLGATNESIDDIEQEIDAAKQHVDDAEAQQQQASGATDTAKAELESFKAQTERGVQAPSARTGRPHFPFAGAPARCGRRLNLQRGATP